MLTKVNFSKSKTELMFYCVDSVTLLLFGSQTITLEGVEGGEWAAKVNLD